MADRGDIAGCNDRCGCPFPCHGGAACRCRSSEMASGGDQHKRCACGEHCGCNPCTCPSAVVGAGKGSCRCGEGCSCATCSS